MILSFFFAEEEGNELVLADATVAVVVDLEEDLADLLAGLLGAVEEGLHLLEGDVARVVAVEVAEGALQLLLLQQLLLVARRHQELGEVDAARPVRVDQLQDAPHLFGPQVGAQFGEGADELVPFDDPVAVPVDLLEDAQQLLLVLVGVELRGDVGVDDRLQLVLELNEQRNTWKLRRLLMICFPISGSTCGLARDCYSHGHPKACSALKRFSGSRRSMLMISSLQAGLRLFQIGLLNSTGCVLTFSRISR